MSHSAKVNFTSLNYFSHARLKFQIRSWDFKIFQQLIQKFLGALRRNQTISRRTRSARGTTRWTKTASTRSKSTRKAPSLEFQVVLTRSSSIQTRAARIKLQSFFKNTEKIDHFLTTVHLKILHSSHLFTKNTVKKSHLRCFISNSNHVTNHHCLLV